MVQVLDGGRGEDAASLNLTDLKADSQVTLTVNIDRDGECRLVLRSRSGSGIREEWRYLLLLLDLIRLSRFFFIL